MTIAKLASISHLEIRSSKLSKFANLQPLKSHRRASKFEKSNLQLENSNFRSQVSLSMSSMSQFDSLASKSRESTWPFDDLGRKLRKLCVWLLGEQRKLFIYHRRVVDHSNGQTQPSKQMKLDELSCKQKKRKKLKLRDVLVVVLGDQVQAGKVGDFRWPNWAFGASTVAAVDVFVCFVATTIIVAVAVGAFIWHQTGIPFV